jgi:hypothetical protein
MKIAHFLGFFAFFCLFLSSACRACFCPVLACRGSWPVAGALTSLYVRLGYPWQALTLSRLSCRFACRSCRLCRFVCVCDCVAGCRPVAACVLRAVAVCLYPCQGVRLSNKCSIRAFRTNFRNTCSRVFLTTCQNFQPNLTEFFRTESLKFSTEPNRIGTSVSLEPNL